MNKELTELDTTIRVLKGLLNRERVLFRDHKHELTRGERQSWIKEINSIVRTLRVLKEQRDRVDAIEAIQAQGIF